MSNTSKQFTFDLNSLEKITPLVTAGLNFINEVGSLLGSESEAEDAPKPAPDGPRVYETFDEVPVGQLVSGDSWSVDLIKVRGLEFPLYRNVWGDGKRDSTFTLASNNAFHHGPYREVLN